VNADLSRPIQWTTVVGAQGYWLYLGSTLGAQDLLTTGALSVTSYQPAPLPLGRTVFARIFTQIGGIWQSTDSTFSVGVNLALPATLTYPANGAVNADLTQPIRWSPVVGAQGYWLYLGSTLGAQDLVSAGPTNLTSYQPSTLPLGRTIFARIFTNIGGSWRSTDSSFSVGVTISPPAVLTYPTNGAVNADLTLPIRWTAVVGAQAYWLNIGSTLGAQDLLNSGSMSQTSYQSPALPSGRIVFVRIYTQMGGVWWYTESTFSAR
jgi:hypothetical protein